MKMVEKNKNGGRAAKRIVIATYCSFIAVCVLIVMFHVYDPTRNSLGALSSVCMDIICMLILGIMICSFTFDNYGSKRTTRLYSGLLVATTFAIFLDFLNWAFDGSLAFGHLTFWFTLGSLCMGSLLASILIQYLNSYMEENHHLSKMRMSAKVCSILNIVSFVVTFILGVTGTAFQFVDGHYETGELYDVVEAIPVLSLLYMTIFIICCVKTVGVHDVFAVAGYIIFMIAGALIESAFNIGTTYVAVAIADIFIFVMLQNEIIAMERRNVQKWMMKSSTDELTGFYNRYAYETDMTILEEGILEDNFVYVSVDVNSLKTVNDTYGHNAGDELLSGAAICLKECFGPYGKLYRTGGDEFIALIYAEPELLAELKKKIAELTKEWDGEYVHSLTISCGYVTRLEEQKLSVRQMAILADRRMYEAKSEYYRSAGIERRRR